MVSLFYAAGWQLYVFGITCVWNKFAYWSHVTLKWWGQFKRQNYLDNRYSLLVYFWQSIPSGRDFCWEGHIHVSDMSMRCVSTLLLMEVQQHSASKHKHRIEFLSRTCFILQYNHTQLALFVGKGSLRGFTQTPLFGLQQICALPSHTF